MERWIKEIHLKHTKCKKALLIMDTFRAPCTEKVINLLSKHHSSVALIPGGCTSKLQPLDVSLNKPFKQVCRQEFSAYCRSQLSTMSNSADRLKTASKQEVCQWLIKVQDHLCTHPDMIVKAFKVTGLSLALDGSEDNLFRNQHLLQGVEAGAQDDDIDAEPEDEDPFASDSNSDSDCECDSDCNNSD